MSGQRVACRSRSLPSKVQYVAIRPFGHGGSVYCSRAQQPAAQQAHDCQRQRRQSTTYINSVINCRAQLCATSPGSHVPCTDHTATAVLPPTHSQSPCTPPSNLRGLHPAMHALDTQKRSDPHANDPFLQRVRTTLSRPRGTGTPGRQGPRPPQGPPPARGSPRRCRPRSVPQ